MTYHSSFKNLKACFKESPLGLFKSCQQKSETLNTSLIEKLISFPTNFKYICNNLNLFQAWAKSEQSLLTKHYPRANHIVINSADKHMLYRNPKAVIEPVSRIIRQYKNRMKTKQK